MKKILFGFIMLFAFMFSVNAETLNMNLIKEDGKIHNFNVVVKDVKGANNVFEGTINYDVKNVEKVALEAVNGWELYTKAENGKLRFIVLNMTGSASNDTVLFKMNASFREFGDIKLDNIGAAGSGTGITLSGIKYSFEEKKNDVNTEGSTEVKPEENPTLPEDGNTNNIEDAKPEDKEEVEEKEEQKNEINWGKIILSIIVVGILGGFTGLFLFRRGLFNNKKRR